MEAAVRRTVVLDSAPPPSSRAGRTVLLETEPRSTRVGYSVGGITVSAVNAARVNQFLANGQAEFTTTTRGSPELEATLRIFAGGQRMELVNEPIGDVEFEVNVQDCSVEAVAADEIMVRTPNHGAMRLLCAQAHLAHATFGAFKSRGTGA